MSSSHSSQRDFFELFSFEADYQVDKKSLKQKYRELQIQYHPDQFSSASEGEKMMAVQMSSLLNDGYEVLSHPVKRAQYLLERQGVNLQEDRKIDPEILMEQMSLREEFEEMGSIADEDQKEQSYESLLDQLQKSFKSCEQAFGEQSSSNELADKDLEGLKQLLARMLFLDKLISEVDKALESFTF